MCGLFGRISATSKPIDVRKLNVLGVHNDERGGDSVGLFIDGKAEYGVELQKLYFNFMATSEILKEKKEAKIILGHTRKASVGGVSLKTAQPVLLTSKDNKVKFAMIHNGTIFNYLALAEKYIPDLDITGLTDSQVMAYIFYYRGYDVLEEYQGAGVFIIADYRDIEADPKILIFKGSSKKYLYSKDPEEERPLYITFEGDEIWFSSLFTMLDAISYPIESVRLKENLLSKVVSNDGVLGLELIREIDRSNAFQYKDSLQNQREYVYSYRDGGYVCDYGTSQSSGIYGNNKTKSIESASKILLGKRTSWIKADKTTIKNKVTLLSDGYFYLNDNILNGAMTLSDLGYRTYGQNSLKTYCFFEGRLLPNYKIFSMIEDIQTNMGLNKEEFSLFYPEVLDFFSYMPTVNLIDAISSDAEFFIQKDLATAEVFSGKLIPLFSQDRIEYIIKNGRIHQSITGNSSLTKDREEAYNLFVKSWENSKDSVEDLEQLVISFIEECTEKEKTNAISK